MACQRVTEAVCFVLKEEEDADALAYIDDFGGVPGPVLYIANTQYIAIKTILLDLGLNIAWEKCIPPTLILTWTGTTFNSIKMVMSIDAEKVQEALDLVQHYVSQEVMSLKEMETLQGKLLYATKLSVPARKFLNRVLAFRRCLPEVGSLQIPLGVKDDLNWQIQFLHAYNSKAIIRSRLSPSQYLYTDASLTGGGALFEDNAYFAVSWVSPVTDWELSITGLEIFTVLLAFRAWQDQLQGSTVQVWTDSEVTVTTIRSGKTRNDFTAACLRELWMICALADIDVLVSHISGSDNVLADMFSRFNTTSKLQHDFAQFESTTPLLRTPVTHQHLVSPDSTRSG